MSLELIDPESSAVRNVAVLQRIVVSLHNTFNELPNNDLLHGITVLVDLWAYGVLPGFPNATFSNRELQL